MLAVPEQVPLIKKSDGVQRGGVMLANGPTCPVTTTSVSVIGPLKSLVDGLVTVMVKSHGWPTAHSA
jgi:hypothetical protein